MSAASIVKLSLNHSAEPAARNESPREASNK
jgi:hypothetical protein